MLKQGSGSIMKYLQPTMEKTLVRQTRRRKALATDGTLFCGFLNLQGFILKVPIRNLIWTVTFAGAEQDTPLI